MPIKPNRIFRNLSPHPLLLLLLLLLPAAAHADSRAQVREAVSLKRAGRLAEALAKYEAALDADRGTLAIRHDGLLPDLIDVWKRRAESGDPETMLRHAYLLDISGRTDEARETYARVAAGRHPEFARRAEDNLAVLDRERQTYDAYLATMRARAAEARAQREARIADLLRSESYEEASRAQAEAAAEANATTEAREAELVLALEKAEAALAASDREAWRTKRDWYGNEGARKWRGKPGEPDRTYDNTLRRRYRQAGSARDGAAAEVERLRDELKAHRELSPGTPD